MLVIFSPLNAYQRKSLKLECNCLWPSSAVLGTHRRHKKAGRQRGNNSAVEAKRGAEKGGCYFKHRKSAMGLRGCRPSGSNRSSKR